MATARLFLMSTHGPGSSQNAQISLSQKFDLTPIAELVVPRDEGGFLGYVWAFRDGSPLMRSDNPPQAGDLAVTTTRVSPGSDGVAVQRIFPVTGVIPGRPDVPELLGIRWNGDGWNNIVLLGDPIILDPPASFALLDERFNIRPGPRFAAKFINADPDEFVGFARANAVAANQTAAQVRLDWTWEEQLLAFQLARSGNPSSSDDPRVVELSERLRSLDIHPVERRPANFRSPDSIRRKCGDILTHAPDYTGKRTSGSRLDTEVWNRYGDLTEEELDDLVELVLEGRRILERAAVEGAPEAPDPDYDPHAAVIKGGYSEGVTRRRRGQRSFRKRLLQIVGPVCLITGDDASAPDTVLDAAHLYSFAKTGEHLPRGGTLMRKDLHALFDADLIAVDPSDWTVWVSPALAAHSQYSQLAGKKASEAWRPHLDDDLLAKRLAAARDLVNPE